MKQRPGRDWILLVLLCALGGVLGRFQTIARSEGRIDTLSLGAQNVCGLIALPLGATLDGVENFFEGIGRSSRLAAENRRLRSQLGALELYDSQVEFYRREAERLRKLLEVDSPVRSQKIPARIVAYFPLENRITLNAGRLSGIRAGLPVISATGLVGIVQSVADASCQILLLSSPSLTIGALVDRDPPMAGLLVGESVNSLALDYLDIQSNVQVGDRVVTSGYSEFIPAGIPIGRIVQVQDDLGYGTKRCTVFPNVQVGEVREVIVLR